MFLPNSLYMKFSLPLRKFRRGALLLMGRLRGLSGAREMPALVVNSAGRTAPFWHEQRVLLLAEGVGFKENGYVDMKRFQWDV